MLGIKTPPRASDADEAEKPFWISYADLMTALMVLFLVAMSVSLFSITQKVISGPEQHEKKKEACMAEVSAMAKSEFPGVSVRGHTISFGTLAQFKLNDHKLDASAEAILRKFVPRVLALASTGQCKEVFKRVVVEGFASQSGTYIHNLNLSIQRAERLLCVLLDPLAPGALAENDRKDVRKLFLVGGRSFNDLKDGRRPEESQRIELTLEFLNYSLTSGVEKRENSRDTPLDPPQKCPLDT